MTIPYNRYQNHEFTTIWPTNKHYFKLHLYTLFIHYLHFYRMSLLFSNAQVGFKIWNFPYCIIETTFFTKK